MRGQRSNGYGKASKQENGYHAPPPYVDMARKQIHSRDTTRANPEHAQKQTRFCFMILRCGTPLISITRWARARTHTHRSLPSRASIRHKTQGNGRRTNTSLYTPSFPSRITIFFFSNHFSLFYPHTKIHTPLRAATPLLSRSQSRLLPLPRHSPLPAVWR